MKITQEDKGVLVINGEMKTIEDYTAIKKMLLAVS